MSSKKESLVCVGGPYDGRRIEIDKGQEFLNLAVRTLPTFTKPVDLATVSFCDFIYRRIAYQAGADVIRTFLAPNNATPEETLNRLLDGYRQPVPDRPRTGR